MTHFYAYLNVSRQALATYGEEPQDNLVADPGADVYVRTTADGCGNDSKSVWRNDTRDITVALLGEPYLELPAQEGLPPRFSLCGVDQVGAAYQSGGVQALADLSGQFTVIIYDGSRNRLLVVQDVCSGTQHVYYSANNDEVIVSSDLRRVLQQKNGDVRIAWEVLPVLMSYSFVPGRHTVFDGVSKIPAESYLEYNTVSRQHYLRTLTPSDDYCDVESIEDAYLSTIQATLRMWEEADGGECAYLALSSGFDSNLLLSQIIRSGGARKIEVFSVDHQGENSEGGVVKQIVSAYRRRGIDINLHLATVGPESIELLPRVMASYIDPMLQKGNVLQFLLGDLADNLSVPWLTLSEAADQLFRPFFIWALAVLPSMHNRHALVRSDSQADRKPKLSADNRARSSVEFFSGYNGEELNELILGSWSSIDFAGGNPSDVFKNYCLLKKLGATKAGIPVRLPYLSRTLTNLTSIANVLRHHRRRGLGGRFPLLAWWRTYRLLNHKKLQRKVALSAVPKDIAPLLHKIGGDTPTQALLTDRKLVTSVLSGIKRQEFVGELFDTAAIDRKTEVLYGGSDAEGWVAADQITMFIEFVIWYKWNIELKQYASHDRCELTTLELLQAH